MSDLSMWGYWRDEYGRVEALEEKYPELLREDDLLRYCVNAIRAAELAIDSAMEIRLAEAESQAT